MMTRTGTDQIWAREEGKHKKQRERVWHYPPLPIGASRAVWHRKGRGGGRSGGLKGHGDRTGQEASRAAPVPGAMAERGARAAMADPRTQEALAGQGTREAMADRGARVAMVDPGTQEAMADRRAWVAMVDPGTQEALAGQGTRETMAERGAWEAMAGSPPPKISLGKFPSRYSGEPDGAGRGSGELDGASRGSGELDGASRGSGELDGASRGSGELDGTSRGSEELDGASRGSGELDGTSRGSGELDGTRRGSGELDGTSRGSGELDGAGRGSGELDGASRGSGELDGASRDTSGLTWATNGPGLEVAANGGGSPANNRLDEPQTAAEIPRERRARTSRGRRRSIAAGAKPGNKNFQNREENKTGWKWHRGHCIFGSSILSRMYGGARNEEAWNFFWTLYLET